MNKTVKTQTMIKTDKVPWEIAEEATKIAQYGGVRYAFEIVEVLAVACIIPNQYFYASIAILLVFYFHGGVFYFGKISRLLKEHEKNKWNKMALIGLCCYGASFAFKDLQIESEFFSYYPQILFYIPMLFALPVYLVAHSLGHKAEKLYFRSKGYDFTGHYGHIGYPEDDGKSFNK